MEMIARFRGTCRECGNGIKRGERIEWSRGLGAAHVRCVDGPQDGGFRPGYSTEAMLEDELTFERMAGESFMAGLR
jgi:hypothetical protein